MATIKERLEEKIKSAYVHGIKNRIDVGTSDLIKQHAAEQCESIVEDVAVQFHEWVELMRVSNSTKWRSLTNKELYKQFKIEMGL